MGSPSIQEIVAIFGQPVAGNPTQFMMERSFAHEGLDWRYLTLEVTPEHLEAAVRGLRAMGLRSVNIARPHKIPTLALVDRASETARRAGAVNCIVRDGDELVGENTDGASFLKLLDGVADPKGKTVAILGAGGAARAIGAVLADSGAVHISVVSANEDHARSTAEAIRGASSASVEGVTWSGNFEVPPGTGILVHAGSIGLYEADPRVAVAIKTLKPPMVVADLSVNPPETWLLHEARQHGCQTLAGLGFLVNQTAAAFKMWTGTDADTGVLTEALEEFLGF